MKKIILTICLFLCAVALTAVGASLAWFTDTDASGSVMTVGNVEIGHCEGTRSSSAEDAVLLPGGEKLPREVRVKNSGKHDAYIRSLFAFEDTRELRSAVHYDSPAPFVFPSNGEDWLRFKVTELATGEQTVYTVGYYIYSGPNGDGSIPAGASAGASMESLWLDSSVDSRWTELAGSQYEVLTLSQACQAVSTQDPETALNDAFGSLTADADAQVAAWFAELLGDGYTVTACDDAGKPWYEN